MDSLLHELDNDALLMMYLADELSVEDRSDVEQLLGVDGGLRAGLVAVRAESEAAAHALDVADRVDPPGGISASAEAVAVRRVGRALRQFQVDTLIRNRPAPVPERQPAFPSWAYPIGAVAAALLVAIGWWTWERHSASRDGANGQLADGRPMYGGWGRGNGFGWGNGFGGMRANIVGDAFGEGAGSTAALAGAEYEANALRHDPDPTELPALFGDTAAN